MDEKDKDLLLKDICGRLLPYGVKTPYSGFEMTIRGVDVESKTVDVIDWGKARFAAVRIEKIKPYLRTLDDLTDEEKRQYELLTKHYAPNPYPVMDWLNEHHVDYRGLIPKGLALEAKDGMYNNWNEKDMARNKQLTVGELEHYLSLIKNKDIKVCVGVGEGEYPLCFLLNSRGDLLLYTSLCQQKQDENLNEVLSLNIITKNNDN